MVFRGYEPFRRPRLIPSLPSSTPSCVALYSQITKKAYVSRVPPSNNRPLIHLWKQSLTYALIVRVPLDFIAYARDDLLKVLFIVVEQRGGRSVHGLILVAFFPRGTTVNV